MDELNKQNLEQQTTANAVTTPDYSNEIAAMYDAQRQSQLQSLENAYNQNLQTLNQSKTEIAPVYAKQSNDLATQYERNRRNIHMAGDINGLNTGTASQIDLAQNSAYLNAYGNIRANQAAAERSVDNQVANLELIYKNAVADAIAQNDYEKAAAMLNEYKRRDEALEEKRRYQYNIDFNERKYNDAMALESAQNRAAYGDFGGYAAVYGQDAADAMQQFWIFNNPDYALAQGLITPDDYYNMMGYYPGESGSGGYYSSGGRSSSGGGRNGRNGSDGSGGNYSSNGGSNSSAGITSDVSSLISGSGKEQMLSDAKSVREGKQTGEVAATKGGTKETPKSWGEMVDEYNKYLADVEAAGGDAGYLKGQMDTAEAAKTAEHQRVQKQAVDEAIALGYKPGTPEFTKFLDLYLYGTDTTPGALDNDKAYQDTLTTYNELKSKYDSVVAGEEAAANSQARKDALNKAFEAVGKRMLDTAITNTAGAISPVLGYAVSGNLRKDAAEDWEMFGSPAASWIDKNLIGTPEETYARYVADGNRNRAALAYVFGDDVANWLVPQDPSIEELLAAKSAREGGQARNPYSNDRTRLRAEPTHIGKMGPRNLVKNPQSLSEYSSAYDKAVKSMESGLKNVSRNVKNKTSTANTKEKTSSEKQGNTKTKQEKTKTKNATKN